MKLGDPTTERFCVHNRSELCQLGAKFSQPLLELGFIRARGIKVAQLLAVRGPFQGVARRGRVQKRAKDGEVSLRHDVEETPTRPFRGDLRALQPPSAGILIKVVAGTDLKIQVALLQAGWHRQERLGVGRRLVDRGWSPATGAGQRGAEQGAKERTCAPAHVPTKPVFKSESTGYLPNQTENNASPKSLPSMIDCSPEPEIVVPFPGT